MEQEKVIPNENLSKLRALVDEFTTKDSNELDVSNEIKTVAAAAADDVIKKAADVAECVIKKASDVAENTIKKAAEIAANVIKDAAIIADELHKISKKD